MNPPSAFGTFRVLHQIGSGVLGPVFRAYDAQQERLVAIKAFKLDLVPEQAERFAEALRAIPALTLAHPSIVAALDAGLEGNTPFLALEYIAGDGLDVALRQFGPPAIADALTLCDALALAIDAAWDAGLGHGALHPRDVFVLSGTGEISITGFGVAQALERVDCKVPLRRPYASPERTAGAPWDRRADVYAMAAIAKEVLTACRPGAAVAKLDEVWRHGLASDPTERFATGALLAAAVRDALAGEPVQAPAVPVVEVPPIAIADAPSINKVQISVDLPGPEDDLPLASEALPVVAAQVQHSSFPWVATIAVAIAGVAIGSVGGYRFGRARGASDAIARVMADTPKPKADPVQVATAPAEPAPPSVPQTAQPGPPVFDQPIRRSVSSTTAALGSLNVDSRPQGARVTVDGRAHGQTPVRIPGLSPGDHRVLIELSGHRRVASTVKVVRGEQARLAVRLEETGTALVRKKN